MPAVLATVRDRFWRAFWLRQQKYLPPAAQVMISGLYAEVHKDATVPALVVNIGREWADRA